MKGLANHIFILSLFALLPVATESLRFWQLRSPIEIKIQKNSPPYQAFKLLQLNSPSPLEASAQVKSVEKLSTENSSSAAIQSYQNIVLLEPLVIRKFQGVTIQKDLYEPADTSWFNTLPPQQRARMEEAQSRYSILFDEDEAKRNLIEEQHSPLQISATPTGFSIKGPIEIAGGLALTNDHVIELRRSVEGSPREAGQVSVKEGTYNIHVNNLVGTLIAKMYAKDGRILGEGNLHLAKEILQTGVAPKLVIRPQIPWAGTAYDGYNRNKTPDGTQIAGWKDETRFESKEDGFQMAGVAQDSVTVVRASAPDFEPTNTILMAGSPFKTPLFRKSMVKALKEIVSEQLSYDLNDPNLPIIWGQVLLSGKPMAGATVEIEGLEGVKTIYFNELNLPDVQLKETTSNGGFVILGVEEGFHALIAKRGDAYFAHNVVVVEDGTVSLTQLESTLKTKDVPVRVYDAFTGSPQSADLEMQSLETPLRVDSEGWATVLLPKISRYSLMDVTPDPEYLPAQYFYDDNQEYIHVPLVQERWLVSILQPKWNIIDNKKGTIIGFFQNEDFEVYLAGEENFPIENITFFNSQGAQVFEGVAGGGFIINNVEVGTHEVVIFGKASEKIYSKILPVDEKSVSVLSFIQ